MSQPVHTPGPLALEVGEKHCFHEGNRVAITLSGLEDGETFNVTIAELWPAAGDQDVADGRLLTAAYNAFDSAAEKLGLNAVELAERMHEAGIADLFTALNNLMPEIESEIEQRQQSGDDEYWMPLDALAADARAVLAKVKGGADE